MSTCNEGYASWLCLILGIIEAAQVAKNSFDFQLNLNLIYQFILRTWKVLIVPRPWNALNFQRNSYKVSAHFSTIQRINTKGFCAVFLKKTPHFSAFLKKFLENFMTPVLLAVSKFSERTSKFGWNLLESQKNFFCHLSSLKDAENQAKSKPWLHVNNFWHCFF